MLDQLRPQIDRSPSPTKRDRWGTLTHGQPHLDLILHAQIPAVGVPQKDQAHHGQEVLVAGEAGVRPQRIRRAPQSSFDRFDVLKLRQGRWLVQVGIVTAIV